MFRDGLSSGVRALADEMGLYDFLNPAVDTSSSNAIDKGADTPQEALATPPMTTRQSARCHRAFRHAES